MLSGPEHCLPHTRPVDGGRLVSASGMEDREMGVAEKQVLPAVCPHAKLLEGRFVRGSGHGHCCSPKLNDPALL